LVGGLIGVPWLGLIGIRGGCVCGWFLWQRHE
jgi:hypothetical protein